MHARRLFLCICLLLGPLLALTGLGAGASMRETGVFLNSRANLGGERILTFTPQDSGEYALYALPLDNEVSCRVVCGEETVLEGNLPLTISMEEGKNYHLHLSGGEGHFEIMRLAHGRSYTSPITLTEANLRYTKSVTSPRDVHWYSFTAPEAGLYTFRTETATNVPLDTVGYLLNTEGEQLAYCDDIMPRTDPNFRIFQELEAGEEVRIRVSAFSNDTGLYRLVVALPEGTRGEPEEIRLAVTETEMDIGGEMALQASLQPKKAYHDLAYSTSNHEVALVSPEGVITAVGAGKAKITVSGYGGAYAVCQVRVRPIEATDLTLNKTEITLSVENTASLVPIFTPANASDQSVVFESSDPAVIQVDERGQITALAEGQCTVTATSAHGLTAQAAITVTPRSAVYRALVMSEYLYDDGRTRTGAVNTAQGITDMLETNGYTTTLLLDSTYDELAEGVRTAFAGAQAGDVSLFYINCHGKTADGIAYFELHDGARVTPWGLAALLRKVPGKVVVLLDFCQSGAFLSHDGWRSPLDSSQFLVLASADPEQDSYRLGDGRDTSEAGMATVFARSLSEGAGWDLMRDKATLRKADANGDGQLTFEECGSYVMGRVPAYLDGTGAMQSPQSSAADGSLILFPQTES